MQLGRLLYIFPTPLYIDGQIAMMLSIPLFVYFRNIIGLEALLVLPQLSSK
jgi:hypothetical protein